MAKERQGKCTPEVIRKVCILIMNGLSWTAIAEVVEPSKRTMENWRNPEHSMYEPKFAKAVKKAFAKYDITPIKDRQFEEAKKHTLKKRIKERMLIDSRTKKHKRHKPPPAMPPSNCKKDYLIKYARDFLDLRLTKKLSVPVMREKCRQKIDYLTEEVLVVVKEYEQDVDSNPNAVKAVMTNCGPEDERWNFKEEMAVSGDINIENVTFGKPGKKKAS